MSRTGDRREPSQTESNVPSRIPGSRVTTLLASCVAGLASAPVIASAHAGHGSHGIVDGPTAVAMVLSGLLFVGAGAYLAGREDVARLYANVGIGTGLLVVLVGIGLYLA